MVANTKPPGPKTGLVTRGCYAAALRDCDGRPPSREHYISECLLERVPGLRIAGLPWSRESKKRPTSAYVGNVLCERHNNALGSVDAVIGKLYDTLLTVRHGKPVGWQAMDGEDLERWALKTLFGMVSSGNVMWSAGVESERPDPPEDHLRILFGEAEMPDSGGLSLIRDGVGADERPGSKEQAQMTIKPLVFPLDHVKAGQLGGVVVDILGLGFYTTVNTPFLDSVLSHRPLGIEFKDQGCLALRCDGSSPSRGR